VDTATPELLSSTEFQPGNGHPFLELGLSCLSETRVRPLLCLLRSRVTDRMSGNSLSLPRCTSLLCAFRLKLTQVFSLTHAPLTLSLWKERERYDLRPWVIT